MFAPLPSSELGTQSRGVLKRAVGPGPGHKSPNVTLLGNKTINNKPVNMFFREFWETCFLICRMDYNLDSLGCKWIK